MSNDEQREKWKYDFAWKGRDIAQQVNDRLDSKAVNIINFSCLLIPIITAILFFVVDKPFIPEFSSFLLIGSIILLFISIFFAFLTTWLRDQGIIEVNDLFKVIKGYGTITDIMGKTAVNIADWQKLILDAGINKRKYLLISSSFFITAMLFISFSAISMLYSNLV